MREAVSIETVAGSLANNVKPGQDRISGFTGSSTEVQQILGRSKSDLIIQRSEP